MSQPAPETNAEPENLLAGRNPIREAIKAGRDIEKLMVARGDLSGSAREIVAKAREAGIVVQEVDRARLDAIYQGHQGMIAFVSAAAYAELDDIFEAAAERGEEPFVVVLDGITDPHNLGAIIRTAECAGAHGVVIPERRSVGLTPAAVKASAGACEYMNVVRVTNINRALDTLKDRGLWIVGATMDGEDAFKADLTGPIAIVIGAEGEGIAELTLKKCDLRLSLPMKGHIESLNASVAAGVMMYAVANARRS
ncbi:MAG: 23S rRNA (guanosine(2251)-2'-O)-methyltransferase RlmB [Clostridia bacterium]|nr:23S rRNA (guanosine(2251)-2'-O)-methyltransferase RlmB [Clostridia bacterium]